MEKSVAEQIAEMKNAISALDTQRIVLGDAAVEAAISGVRQKLDALHEMSQERQRKQVTVLFADVSGFTALSETMDAEDVNEMMNAIWKRLDAAIVELGGTIDKHIGDAVMALWGTDAAREDDPERAILAGLRMQAVLQQFGEETRRGGAQPKMRIGINTGPALLGEVGTTGEFTAMGDTVNLASRLEHAAPVGTVLISVDTYRHVRGVFDVIEQDPITVKGRQELVQVYVVTAVKPRAFRIGMRGVEGVETNMVGRDAEFKRMQDAYNSALNRHQIGAFTISGDAGVGKTRLVHEFTKWIEVRREKVWFFHARARQQMMSTPFAVMREMLANRFEIQDSDPAAVAREKLVNRVMSFLGDESEEKAHYIGQLIGLDFSASAHLSGVLSNAQQIRDMAFHYVAQLFRAVHESDANPLLLQFDDIQWADDGTLDLIESLIRGCRDLPIMVICVARPVLFERRPGWASGGAPHRQVELQPLTRGDCGRLVDDILQKADAVPEALRELIVGRAEGNPYYVEELVKMLIEDGVIVKGDDRWRVEGEKLVHVRVPATLTGVLQARLDSLPPEERAALQRAAVVGRIFWDSAVSFLSRDSVQPLVEPGLLLGALAGRELIFERETSAFYGAHEYTFKHTILHEVAYESVLKKQRRTYHGQVAQWLVEQSGERASEYVGLIADHYERAGDAGKALEYMEQAGRQAVHVSSFREAIRFFERGLALANQYRGELLNARQWEGSLRHQLGRAYQYLGDFDGARSNFATSLDTTREINDRAGIARALIGLGVLAEQIGDYDPAETYLRESIDISRQIDELNSLASALTALGDVCYRRSQYDEAETYLRESLEICDEIGDRWRKAGALHSMGFTVWGKGDYDRAMSLFEESLGIRHEVGDLVGIADGLNGMGAVAYMLGDFAAARGYYQQSLETGREISPVSPAVSRALINLGEVAYDMGRYKESLSFMRDALGSSVELGAVPKVLYVLFGMARLKAKDGDPERALEWLTLARNHPSAGSDLLESSQAFLDDLKAELSAQTFKAAVGRGKKLDLDQEVSSILGVAMTSSSA